MSEDVGALVARVVADTEGFRSEMTRLASQVQSNTARMNAQLARIGRASDALAGSFRLVTRVASAFGVALSVRALTQFTGQAINAAAELHNLSVRLNVSVESMSELQHVARVNDIEFGNFSKSLQIMSKNFGEASKGSKSMQETFRQLGLDFKLLSKLSVDQQLEAVAQALARVTDEGQRTAFAQEVLGRGGIEMLQAFERGAVGIRELRQELRDLGGVTSTETARAADEAKDAMDRLKSASVSLSNELVNTLAPALTTATNKLREWLFPTDNEAVIAGTSALIKRLKQDIADIEFSLPGMVGERDSVDWLERLVGMDEAEWDRRIAKKVADLNMLKLQLQQAQAGLARVQGGGATGSGAPGSGGGGAPPVVAGVIAPAKPPQFFGNDFFGGSGPDAAQQAFLEQLRKQQEEKQAIIQEGLDHELQAATDALEARLEISKYQAEQEIAYRQLVTDSAIGLLQALGSKHRGAAIAALAIQKALAVKEIFVQSQVAAMRAMAELGPIAGPPVAAAILAKGKLSAILVAATGLVEAAQLSSGGTQSTLGTTANPISTRAVSSSAGPAVTPHRQNVVEITIHGGVVTSSAVRELVAQIKKEIDDSDVIIIGPDSRQARQLVEAA